MLDVFWDLLSFVSCIVATFACVFLMSSCISSVLLQMPFALNCRTLRKFFGDVVLICLCSVVKSAVKCAVPRVVVVLYSDLEAFSMHPVLCVVT